MLEHRGRRSAQPDGSRRPNRRDPRIGATQRAIAFERFAMTQSAPRILALANQKGGVGKTTTAINLGTALAAIGERVLIIDLDPQGNASTGLGIDRKIRLRSTYDVLIGSTPLRGAILETAVPRLHIAPSTLDLTGHGIVLTMYDARNNLSGQVVADVRQFMGEKVYQTIIPRNVRVSEAPSYGKPVLLYDLKCVGSQAYLRLASEIIQREKILRAA